MGADRAHVSGGTQWRSAAHDLPAQGNGCDFVCCIERRRLADAAEMLPADFDGARLFL